MKRVLLSLPIVLLWLEICCAGVQIMGGLTQEKTVRPGDRTKGEIVIKNTGESAAEVKIYKTDYSFEADGRTRYDDPGTASRSNASWIAFSPSRLSIPPKESISISYTIDVPESSLLSGTYWSMLMVEPSAEIVQKGEADLPGIGVVTIVRYGIQMIVNIAGTGAAGIRFLDKKLITSDGKQVLQIDIENNGELGLTPAVWAELYDKNGAEAGRFSAGKKRIYPGTSVRYAIDLSGILHGRYKTLVVADNGDDHIFGAQYDLVIE